jgi:hypothetical protein
MDTPLKLTIYPFYAAPKYIQDLSRNGGDEDHVYIIYQDDDKIFGDLVEDIVDKMAKCDYHRYEELYQGRPCYIYITNHG